MSQYQSIMRSLSVAYVLSIGIGLWSCGEPLDSLHQSAHPVETILPNWATDAEIQSRQSSDVLPKVTKTLPPAGFRVPAEYEPQQAVLMTWEGFRDMLRDITKAVTQSNTKVWMVGGPDTLPQAVAGLYQSINLSYDTVWTRDYGPMGIHEDSNQLGIVDTTYRHYQYRKNDDAMPCRLAKKKGLTCYSSDLILDGGNFLTDRNRNLFITRRIYDWNSHLSKAEVDQRLRDVFAIKKIHRFQYAKTNNGEPADGTGHIDMFVKLLSDCVVLVAETDDAPFRGVLEEAADYFKQLTCEPDGTYQVLRIKGWYKNSTWYTYTNSLMVNQTVIIPAYQNGNNQAAKQIYQKALPNHKIVPVFSDNSISLGGSIHCVTKEIPALPTSSGCMNATDCQLANVQQHTCQDGQCGIGQCEPLWADCNAQPNDGCETKLNTDQNCAQCGDDCSGLDHATASCQSSTCVIESCLADFDDCDNWAQNGCETELNTDQNCAQCGDACDSPNASCQSGTCVFDGCQAGFADCDSWAQNGCETELNTDQNCARCGDDCGSLDHATASCQSNICVIESCLTDFDDCDNFAHNGCETDITTFEHCGECHRNCSTELGQAAGSCIAGQCQAGQCESGFADCDQSETNGCEADLSQPQTCGACQTTCQPSQNCVQAGHSYECKANTTNTNPFLGCASSPQEEGSLWFWLFSLFWLGARAKVE